MPLPSLPSPSQEAVSLVEKQRASGADARRACHELVREAAARWHAKEGAYRDDITALLDVIYTPTLPPTAPPPGLTPLSTPPSPSLSLQALLVMLDGGRPSVATATAAATGGAAAAGGAATAAAAGGASVANGTAKRRGSGSGGGGGGGNGVAAAALTDTLEFLSVAELAEELSGEALLPPEARR